VSLRTRSMAQVEVIRDVIFREVDGVRLRLDVYRPRNRPAQLLPSVLFVHGGAWVVGSKRQSPFLMFDLAAAGYVVFSVNYRLAPRFPLPAAIHDCKAAVVWVREHAAQYGGTPEAIAMGNSAGGHLAAMLACSAQDRSLQPGFEDKDCSVRAGVILYGLSDIAGIFEDHPNPVAHYLFEELVFCRRYREHQDVYRRSQPVSYLSAEIPPLLLIHGEHDVMIPILEARNFYDRLKQAGARRVHLCEVPLAPHAFEIAPTPLQQRTQRIIESFLQTV
jgi:acetyl esterase/lipase